MEPLYTIFLSVSGAEPWGGWGRLPAVGLLAEGLTGLEAKREEGATKPELKQTASTCPSYWHLPHQSWSRFLSHPDFL